MLTFLIPVKPARYVNNFIKFNILLDKTLEYASLVPNSQILLVSNNPLETRVSVNNLVVMDLNLSYGDDDKEFKVYQGCLYWLNSGCTEYDSIMILDCDDLVLPEIQNPLFLSKGNIYFRYGYQQIFNRFFLYKKNFYQHCGSSFIFNKHYIESKIPEYKVGKRWMFHRDHNLFTMTPIDVPCVIQRPWNGENVWWSKMRFRDVVKWFFAEKTTSSTY